MRTYDDIVNEYLFWYSKKYKKPEFVPSKYLDVEEKEKNLRKASIWKKILDLAYHKTNGIYWFCKFILGDLTSVGYPTPIRFNNLFWKWNKLLQNGDHVSIICGRQHGKTTNFSVLHPIYRITMFPFYNILIESASEDQAINILTNITKIIENNEFLISKKADKSKWSTTEIHFNGGKILAKGVGSEVRGGTFDYIVADDILRSDNKLSDRDIENFIDEELEPMILVRHGQLVLVGTRKSDTDIFSTILERIENGSAWQSHTFPAILDKEKKEILCPDRFTWEQLQHKKQIMGERKFAKEFLCVVYSSGSQLFNTGLRKEAMERGKDWSYSEALKPEEIQKWRFYMGIDVASAGSASADYTVCIVLAHNIHTQEKRLAYMWRKKGLKISEQAENVAIISRRFNNPIILVEKNNVGQSFIDVLVDNYNLSVESFTTTKLSKDDLIRTLITAFENNKIILPFKTEQDKEITHTIDSELDRFVVETTKAGNEVMKGSGHSHDDIVISLALANRCTQSSGYEPFAQSTGQRKSTSLERFSQTGDIIEVMRL